jgi:outer membrane protein
MLHRLATAFLIALAFFANNGALAEGLPPATIAVLDFQYVIRESEAAKDIRRQLQSIRERYQAEIMATESDLRRQEQELKQQQAVLTPQAFNDKRQEFERKVIDVQRRVQDRARELDRAFNAAMAEVQKAVIPIVKEMTVQRNFNVVVDKSQVLFAKKTLDITEDVVVILNQRLSSVKVPEPAK